MQKLRTVITDANGGMDSPTNYRKAMEMLKTHPYTNARLYHLVLTGSDNREDYRFAVDRLCRELRANDMPCMWKACYELDDKKRFHSHLFILVESANKVPCTVIRYSKDGWLVNLLASRGLGFNISQPQNPIHWQGGKPQNYAYVPKKAGPKLDDCLIWISYLFKVRSKAGVEGQIYTSSTNRGSAKTRPAKAEAPAPAEQPTNDNEGEDMTDNALTPAGHAYITRLYEGFVDKGLNVVQIRAELGKAGIRRTLGQVVYDLDHRYSFSGYAARHPAPQVLTYAELDAIEEAKASKPARILVRSKGTGHTENQVRIDLVATTKRSYNGCNSTATLER